MEALEDRHGDLGRADPLLAALARLARVDAEAAGLLFAALAPEVRGLAVRYARTLGYDEALAVAVAAIWDRIARFGPPTSHVAYRLRWLAGRRVHRAAVTQRNAWAHTSHLEDTDGAAGTRVDQDLSVAVLLVEAVMAGVVSRSDAWLTAATEVDDVALGDAAAQLGISYEAAKKRRQRAKAALADWWDPHHERVA